MFCLSAVTNTNRLHIPYITVYSVFAAESYLSAFFEVNHFCYQLKYC